MPGVLVDYRRFVEVQERRLRIIAELEETTEALTQQSARTAVGEGIAHVEPVTSLADNATGWQPLR